MLRALTFDGGGIRGLISVILLERLLEHRPQLLDETSLLAGASTGGLIALGLADDYPLSYMRAVYQFHGKEIFTRSWPISLGLFGAKYRSVGLYKEVNAMFSDKQLGQLPKKVLIPTFSLTRGNAKFFTNWDPNDADCSVLVRNIAMATTAAPTYFKTWQGYADGGMAANNPCMAAAALLLDPAMTIPDITAKDIRVLSIGTGSGPQPLAKRSLDWGVVQWGAKLVDVFMEGHEGVPVYECRSILRGNFFRVQPLVKAEYLPGLDEYKRVDELIAIARSHDLGSTFDWLDNHWS